MEPSQSGWLCSGTRLAGDSLSIVFNRIRFFLFNFSTHLSRHFVSFSDSVEEMKSFLSMQQKAMSCLIETVNKDKETMKNIQDKLSELVNKKMSILNGQTEVTEVTSVLFLIPRIIDFKQLVRKNLHNFHFKIFSFSWFTIKINKN